MSRFLVLIVVVAVHLGLVAVFAVSGGRPRERLEEEPSITVVFLPEISTAQPVSRSNPASGAARGSAPGASKRVAPARTLAPPDSSAIAPRLNEVEELPAPASIDWSKEATLSASRQIESMEDARRRAGAFTPWEANRAPPRKSKPEFGWSHARTHRIEALPEGGTLLWINDRCALAISGGLFPVCKLGKIEPRGDLFEFLHDPPEPGDRK
jgi:hypothetical protein